MDECKLTIVASSKKICVSAMSGTLTASTESSLSKSLSKTRLHTINSQTQILQSLSLTTAEKGRRRRWQCLEAAGITLVIVIVAGLMSLPVAFFYLPRVCETLQARSSWILMH